MTEQHWFVGQTRAGLGPWAEKNLAAQGILHYVPRIIGPDGVTGVNLFTRYLFVCLDPTSRNFTRVNSTRGMHKLLPLYSESPTQCRPGYVEELIRRVGVMGRLEDAEEVTYDYVKNEQVAVVCGHLAGSSGTFQHRKKGLAMLLMYVMGRQTLVGVPLAATEPMRRNDVAALVTEPAPC